MLKTIWATVQILWNDPVWSKVIATGITAIVLVIWSYFRGWFPIIGQWLALEIIVSRWLLITVPVFVAIVAWIVSGTIQVESRDQYIAHLGEQVAERDKIIRDWRDACEPIGTNYKTLEGHLTECQNTLKQWSVDGQNTIKKWQDALEGWKKQNSELQKTVNSYVSNCSILSDVHDLDKRKSSLDAILRSCSSGDMFDRARCSDSENLKRESTDFQARILALQHKLRCEPN